MASPILNEQELLNIVYAMYEADTSNWAATSDEYLSARVMANAAINRWEFYEQTNWRELWTTHASTASDIVKTTTAGTYTYACSTDMIKPASYIRTNTTNYWHVVPLNQVPTHANDNTNFVYFTGNIKVGFTLAFNPNTTLTTAHVISYEYYKSATRFTATTSTTEMTDPYFIVYFVLSRLYENDGEDSKASKAFQEAEGRLENMRTQNMLGFENVDDLITGLGDGFGY